MEADLHPPPALVRARRSLLPPPKLRLSEWIEANLRLPAEVSAVPGPIRLPPYLVEIADAMGDPGIERVSVLKSARIGYSTLVVGAIASFVVNDPSSIICLVPSLDDARDLVVSTLEPILQATPATRGALRDDRPDLVNRSTILSRQFRGGSLRVIAARAPRALRAKTARVLIADEIDGYEPTPEGNPLVLAERRTWTFPDRKLIAGSTPTVDTVSNALRLYEASDGRVYEPRCTACGGFHEFRWADIRWPPDRPEEAAWCCPGCGVLHAEEDKAAMVAEGRWRAQKPEVTGHAGFRISSLVSSLPNATWAHLAAEFLAARRDPDLLRVFVNLSLGESWRENAEQLDEDALRSRVEPFGLEKGIPEQVLFLTAGVDVQHDRLECTALGWAADGVVYVLGHRVFYGPVEADEVWRDLDDFLRRDWPHPLGGRVRIDACAVDGGDGQTADRVAAYTATRFGRRVVMVKGASGFSRPPLLRSPTGHRGRGALWIAGVDAVKTTLYRRLALAGQIRFSDTLPAEFFEQLASEKIVVRYSRGQPARQFVRIASRAAEALDSTVYAWCARTLVQSSLERREAELRCEAAPAGGLPPVIRSRWLER